MAKGKKTVTYKVKSGDTLWDISKSLLGAGNKWQQIVKTNHWLEEKGRVDYDKAHVLIHPGEELTIELGGDSSH